jgi:hypothetical protein
MTTAAEGKERPRYKMRFKEICTMMKKYKNQPSIGKPIF